MKKIIFLLFLVPALRCPGQKITQYKAQNSIIYKIGDKVQLGTGSGINGSFLYLQISGWAASMDYDPDKGPDQLNVGRGYANTTVTIKKMKVYKVNHVPKMTFSVGGGNITNYILIIDDAIQSCEVVPCNNSSGSSPPGSVADELLKLKKLLDEGGITQTEYDAQKKKLLSQ